MDTITNISQCRFITMWVGGWCRVKYVCHQKIQLFTVLWFNNCLSVAWYNPQNKFTKSGRSSVECYGHGFLIATPPIRTLP